jgi:hypothetical protein
MKKLLVRATDEPAWANPAGAAVENCRRGNMA